MNTVTMTIDDKVQLFWHISRAWNGKVAQEYLMTTHEAIQGLRSIISNIDPNSALGKKASDLMSDIITHSAEIPSGIESEVESI